MSAKQRGTCSRSMCCDIEVDGCIRSQSFCTLKIIGYGFSKIAYFRGNYNYLLYFFNKHLSNWLLFVCEKHFKQYYKKCFRKEIPYPTFKKATLYTSLVENYRPVSLLIFLLRTSNFHGNKQPAFAKQSPWHKPVPYQKWIFHRKKAFSAAFDTINHYSTFCEQLSQA